MSLFQLPEEDWKPVVGYENLYQVNSKGQVARIGGKVLKPYQGQVYLSKQGKVATIKVCDLVAHAFMPEYKSNQKVYHISGDSDALSNLTLELPKYADDDDWRDIPGYEDYYQASRDGKIRSKDRYNATNNTMRRGKELKVYSDDEGYLRCSLSANGTSKLVLVHRLVASAFIPNPDNKPQVNHIDGNTANNNVTNLEWVTQTENMNHAKDHGLWDPKKCGNIEQMRHGKPVRCITDNKIHNSTASAARYYGMDFQSVKDSIELNRPRKGFQFEYLNKDA